MLNSYDAILKNKRENYRSEIRKKDLNKKMILKRQMLMNGDVICAEKEFNEFLKNFKFMANCSSPKQIPNKNYFEIYQEIMKVLIEEDCKGNIQGILNCLMFVRKLSIEPNKVGAVELIRSGILVYLEKYTDISLKDFPQIHQESCWILSNICALENLDLEFFWSSKLVNNLLILLKSENKDTLLNTIWVLSNLIGDSIEYRDRILKYSGIIDCFVELIFRLKNKQDSLYSQKLLAEALWFVSNICRKPYPPYLETSKFLPLIPDCFNHLPFEEYENLIWIIYYLTDSDENKIKNFMKMNLIPFLLNAAKGQEKMRIPALRVLGTVATSTDENLIILLDHNFLEILETHINGSCKYLRKEISWILSNIMASNSPIIQRVIEHNIFNLMRQKSLHDEVIVRRELLLAFSNGTQNATIEQTLYMIDNDLIYILTNGLDIQDPKIINAILDAIDNLLVINQECNKISNEYGIIHNRIYEELQKYDIVKILDNLQTFPVKDVYEKALSIVERHFINESIN